MVDVLGFDVGGANTKAAFVSVRNGQLLSAKVAVEYYPVWKQPEKLGKVLLKLKEQLVGDRLDGLGVTMTAELSDAYQTKREGVHQILGCFEKVFVDVPIFVLNTDAKLEPMEAADREPLKVAAANWAATGWLVAQHLKDCVVVDVGSKTVIARAYAVIPNTSGGYSTQLIDTVKIVN